jgi:protein TonB
MEKQNQIEGTVYVNFVVEADGSISNIAVSRGVDEGPGFNKAAMGAVSKLKQKFTPAKMNGNPVRLRMTIPVKFSLRQ